MSSWEESTASPRTRNRCCNRSRRSLSWGNRPVCFCSTSPFSPEARPSTRYPGSHGSPKVRKHAACAGSTKPSSAPTSPFPIYRNRRCNQMAQRMSSPGIRVVSSRSTTAFWARPKRSMRHRGPGCSRRGRRKPRRAGSTKPFSRQTIRSPSDPARQHNHRAARLWWRSPTFSAGNTIPSYQDPTRSAKCPSQCDKHRVRMLGRHAHNNRPSCPPTTPSPI
mmetsp:Transcript_134146/g.286872  ORF Transcript_134146/g.286872 Transcript_134146/m.286872 type:complete len:221 (-) Transcript_134146:446-1108(-)